MNDGARILLWASENGHTVTWMAEKIGYSRQRLSDALHQNDISPALAKALFDHFYLRVAPTLEASQPSEDDKKRKARSDRKKPRGHRGRAPGAGREPGKSKLDPYIQEILKLLADGVSQKEIAGRYWTTPSNLHNWLKKRGFNELRALPRDASG